MSKLERTHTLELGEIIDQGIKRILSELNVSLPADVVSYDKSRQSASVQPLIKRKYTKETNPVLLPIIPDVPVQWMVTNGGKSGIRLPLVKGDWGRIVCCQRSISDWLVSDDGKAQDPESERTHDLSDAVFIPGIRPFGKAFTDGGDDDLIVKNDKLTITVDATGKISFQGVSSELLTTLSSLLGNLDTLLANLISAQTLITTGSSSGTYNFTPATAVNLALDKTNIAADKAGLDSLKI